jgi:hypothetical protein
MTNQDITNRCDVLKDAILGLAAELSKCDQHRALDLSKNINQLTEDLSHLAKMIALHGDLTGEQ